METVSLKDWLDKLKSPDADVHNQAARAAGPWGAAAITPVAEMMASPDKGVARAATQAMQHIAYYSTRPGASPLETQRVSEELWKAASTPRPRMIRSQALNLLGLIGSGSIVPWLARLLNDPEVREDARLSLERIPGPQAQRALELALRQAPLDFQPNLRQSLYNRSLTMQSVGTQPGR